MPHLEQKLVEGLAAKGYAVGPTLSGKLASDLRERIATELKDRGRERRALRLLAADVRTGRLALAEATATLAREDRVFDVAELLAGCLDIDARQIFGAIVGSKAETLLVLCRALDFDAATLEALRRAGAHRRRETYAPSAVVARAYEGIARGDAERALRFMKVREAAKPGAVPVQQAG